MGSSLTAAAGFNAWGSADASPPAAVAGWPPDNAEAATSSTAWPSGVAAKSPGPSAWPRTAAAVSTPCPQQERGDRDKEVRAQKAADIPLLPTVANGFLQALWEEYVDAHDDAVQNFFDETNVSERDQDVLQFFEAQVRKASNPRRVLVDLAARWRLEPPPMADPPSPATGNGGYRAPLVEAPKPSLPTVRRDSRHRAVLIGINYFGQKAELRGCVNDVHNMRRLLTETFGWELDCIRQLTDDDPTAAPTRANIEASLRWLVEGVRSGDVLFFHFSGHGAQQEDPHGYEEDGMNETVCPVDFQQSGMMTDDEIGEIVVKHLPEGVRLTAIMDCCHSGTGLDLPFTYMPHGWKEETNPYHSLGDVQLFSGCEDEDTSADAVNQCGSAGGAMTTAFCDLLRAGGVALPYPELLARLNQLMQRRGFAQRPQLTSSQRFDHDRPFLLDDIVPNSNAIVGRTFVRKFPPRPRRMEGPLAEMLGMGAAVVGGFVVADFAASVIGSFI